MQTTDPVTGLARGWMALRRRSHGIALAFSVRCNGESWEGLARRLTSVVGELSSVVNLAALSRAMLPLTSYLELRTPDAPAHRDALATARAALRGVPAFPGVVEAVGAEDAEAVMVLLLAMGDRWTPAQRAAIGATVQGDDGPMDAELRNVRAQLAALSGPRA